jgi:hypothetical protein
MSGTAQTILKQKDTFWFRKVTSKNDGVMCVRGTTQVPILLQLRFLIPFA